MFMQLELPKETTEKITEASKILGMKSQDIIDRAVLVYLDNIRNFLKLKEELAAWDKLSDEALITFERSL